MAETPSAVPAGASKEPWLKVWWASQTPARRKFLVAAGVMSTVFLLAWALVSTPTTGGSEPAGPPENTLLPKEALKDLSVSGVSGDVKDLRNTDRNLQGDVATLKTELSRIEQAGGDAQGNNQRGVDEQLRDLHAQIDALKAERAGGVSPAGGTPPVNLPAGAQPGDAAAPVAPAYGPLRTIGQDSSMTTTGGGSDPKMVPTSADGPRPTTLDQDKRPTLYIPSGSFVRGVLLTGVDAPTGKIATKDPVPVLARLKHDAVLPNLFSSDIRECFVILGAIGDITSERAMMRSERISCVRNDRSVVDIPIDGYAVGEDGKAGLRGTLVSKQGMELRRAMLAGFADSLSRAFGSSSQGLLVSPTGAQQQVSMGQNLEYGGLGGVSSAMDRIAQYYLELADELHPVIEIESGRQVTLVVLQGKDILGGASSGTATPKPIEHVAGHGPAHAAAAQQPMRVNAWNNGDNDE